MRTTQKFYTRVNQKKMSCTTSTRIFQYLINRKNCEYNIFTIFSIYKILKNSLLQDNEFLFISILLYDNIIKYLICSASMLMI